MNIQDASALREHDVEDQDEQHALHDPGDALLAGVGRRGADRARRWVDAGERVAGVVAPSDARHEHQHAEEHEERDRRREVVLDRLAAS